MLKVEIYSEKALDKATIKSAIMEIHQDSEIEFLDGKLGFKILEADHPYSYNKVWMKLNEMLKAS
jgi:hypothetical protein